MKYKKCNIYIKKVLKIIQMNIFFKRYIVYATSNNKENAIKKFKEFYSKVKDNEVHLINQNHSKIAILSDY